MLPNNFFIMTFDPTTRPFVGALLLLQTINKSDVVPRDDMHFHVMEVMFLGLPVASECYTLNE
jgi:hypothetical protein